ncbi:MAG TPA: hypothetical protein DCZ75_01305 [Geobacter sp.]|nr:hypothetical protein [Geobacter sp.]
MKIHLIAAASLVVAGIIAGCGSSSTMSPSGSGTTAIAGKVADGYLENATVFLDKNGNYLLDAGEPFAVTDANGAYTLSVDAADVGQYPIVALAIAGVTYDRTDVSATTPITFSYLMSLPKDGVSGTVSSNFISPFSTEIREMMETGNYADMRAAMDALRASLGLPEGTNMMGDYVAGQNSVMHTAAQNMATLMGGEMLNLYGTSGAIDVNRYRGMMGTMFGNMSTMKLSAQPQTMNEMMVTMDTTLGSITTAEPFRNMSSYFRGGMTGGGRGSMM